VWTSVSQVVPQMKALITSASVMFGSSLHFMEKRWMYSRGDSWTSTCSCGDPSSSLGRCMYLRSGR
jgi:hypothetical protein